MNGKTLQLKNLSPQICDYLVSIANLYQFLLCTSVYIFFVFREKKTIFKLGLVKHALNYGHYAIFYMKDEA